MRGRPAGRRPGGASGRRSPGPGPAASRSAQALWTECARRAPAPLDAFPAALVAACAWLRGDGAVANIALDRALGSEPGNTLARLLADALAAFVPPRQLRALLVEAGRAAGLAGPAGAPAR